MIELTAKPISVLIVDDHAVTQRSLAVVVESFNDLQLIGIARDGVEAIDFCRRAVPDVVLMDLVMPDMDGPSATRAILERWPEVRVIGLTAFTEPRLVSQVLDAGAAYCLLKDVSADDLADAIRMVHSGRWEPATRSRLKFAHHLPADIAVAL